ncbi:MAG: 30S ribosomal protein S20 [Marivibrio sp.]|uniref:30S ribosomal protein S20 n=1 Tax=Marivibrio sp. TaxID=2039719 RepID=UPI0032F05BEA
MANHKSAEKRIRQTAKRRTRNMARRNRIRSSVRKFEDAMKAGDAQAAQAAFAQAMPELHRGVTKGVLHKKTAARKLSRLQKRLKALEA